jgi:adenine-specific DNA glycosylase
MRPWQVEAVSREGLEHAAQGASKKALESLAQLSGVGPATASAILAAARCEACTIRIP